MERNSNPVGRLANLFGGQNRFARAIGRRQSTIWNWVQSGHVPPDAVQAIVDAAAKLDPPRTLTAEDFIDVPAAAVAPHIATADAEVS